MQLLSIALAALSLFGCRVIGTVGIVESSTNQHKLSALCQRRLREVNDEVLISWFDNEQETTAWVQTKNAETIYVRNLKDTKSPLPRRSRYSWWPLRYSAQKRYQRQQFDIYYAGRSFYGIDPRTFKLNDARQLDLRILSRIFPENPGLLLFCIPSVSNPKRKVKSEQISQCTAERSGNPKKQSHSLIQTHCPSHRR